MTWTNYSTTPPNSWSAEIGAAYDVTNNWADNSTPPLINTTFGPQVIIGSSYSSRTSIT